jgi:hypothetical protein
MTIYYYNKSRASGLFIVVMAVLIFALYVQEFHQLIWQQVKLKNLEKLHLHINQYEKNVINQAICALAKYTLIAEIPDLIFSNASNGQAKISLVFYNNNFGIHGINGCSAYKIYKIEIMNLFDLNRVQTYYSKLHTYVAVCEYENNKHEKAIKLVRFSTDVFLVGNF